MSIYNGTIARFGAACVLATSLLGAAPAMADENTTATTVPMLRLYNPYSGEHFYTADEDECEELIYYGWIFENIGWYAPTTSKTPVYRLYNPYTSDHHYTVDGKEHNELVRLGWQSEGVGWYSDDNRTVALLRQFNPYVEIGAHNYTTSVKESDYLISLGWIDEGIAWYGAEAATPYSDTIYIMGKSEATQEQVVAHYEASGATYPEIYASKGAPTIEDFVRILFEVAQSEGVRADIAYAQAMVETSFLQFTGSVGVEQCNFAGLGAGGGNSGNEFEDVRTGLLAQIQHLKAYASTEPLNNPCVDKRFTYVTRGSGPTLYTLSTTWAVDPSYGEYIAEVLDEVLAY